MVPMSKRRRIRGGLSLLEVVLALGILSISLAALAQLISVGSRAAIDSQMRTEAVIRCQSKLSDFVSGSLPLQTAEGLSFADDPRWRWSVYVQQTPVQNLLEVQVTVSRDGADNFSDTEYSLRRYLRDPAFFVRERIKEQDFHQRQQTLIKTTTQPPRETGGKDADQ